MKKSIFLGLVFLLSGQFIHSSQGKTEFPIKMLKNAWNAAASYLPSDRLTAFNYSSVPVIFGSIMLPFLMWERKTIDIQDWHNKIIGNRFSWDEVEAINMKWTTKAVICLPFIVSSLYAVAMIKLNQPFANSSDILVNCDGERIPFESMYKTPAPLKPLFRPQEKHCS